MKTKISPSILGGSFSNMESTIKQLDNSHADYIHFDVMDGDFVPNLTFGPQFISNIRKYSNKVFDVHLMINRVEKFLDEYIKSGSNIITYHLEINENINSLIDSQGADPTPTPDPDPTPTPDPVPDPNPQENIYEPVPDYEVDEVAEVAEVGHSGYE